MLSKVTEVKGSKKRERFVVERLPDDKTHVTVQKINKEGELTKMLFDRTFDNKVTKELRLYGFAGEDQYELTGKVKNGPLVRIIGGIDRDSIVDRSNVAGFRHRLHVYDADSGNVIVPGPDARLRLQPGLDVSRYDVHTRTDRKDYTLNYFGPTLYFGYNVDDRLFLGGGAVYRTYGFRKAPYATEQSLAANYSPSQSAYNVRYLGHFVDVFGDLDLRINSQLYGPQLLYNYFGLGNDTRNILAERGRGRVTNRDINDTYRIRFSRLYVNPMLEKDVFSFLKFGFGPQYDQFRVDRSQIGSEIARPRRQQQRRASARPRASGRPISASTATSVARCTSTSTPPARPKTRALACAFTTRPSTTASSTARSSATAVSPPRPGSISRPTSRSSSPGPAASGPPATSATTASTRPIPWAAPPTCAATAARATPAARRCTPTAKCACSSSTFNAYLLPGKFGILGLADAARVYSPYDTRNWPQSPAHGLWRRRLG